MTDTTERDTKAIAYLKATGNDDLLPILGLVDEQRGGSGRDYACPTCGAAPGARCRKQQDPDATAQQDHRSRYRLAGLERT